jgi:hypothetical protein
MCDYTSGNVLVHDPVVCARNGCTLCAAELDERNDDSWWLV